MRNRLASTTGTIGSSLPSHDFGVSSRFAQKYFANNTEYRLLTKLHGLRFVITITGKGGQFNIVNLFLAIGQ